MEPESSSTVGMACPRCAATVVAGERFCAACGGAISIGDDGTVRALAPAAAAPSADERWLAREAEAKLATARKWLLAVAIITLVSGVIFYAIQSSEVESQIRDAAQATGHMSPEARDAAFKAEIGMTWDEAISHDRGMVKMLLAINIALAVLYFVMWIWAKKNPYAAAITALLLFVTTIVATAALEPESLGKGIIVKIFFTAALIKAISAGSEARKAQRRT